MHTTVERNSEQSEATLKVSATAPELVPYLRAAAKKLSQDNPVAGFRPGKAPVEVVEKAFGRERLLNEAAERAVPQFFVKAVLDEELEPIERPVITLGAVSPEEGLSFTARVSVLPEVVLGDVGSISMEKRAVTVPDTDVDRELTYLAKMRSSAIEVARPAQRGDTVTVDFKVSLDGTLMEGGESKNHPVHLGEGHFVPDFEKNLLGISAGETREFNIEFPPDFTKQSLRGKKAQARVKAHVVQKRVIPEINDDFARQLGKFKDLAALKYALKSNLVREREQKEQERFQGELANKLAEKARFSRIPDALIEKEIDRRVAELRELLTVQRKALEDYLAGQKKSLAEVRDEMRETAKRAVRVSLALRKFATEQNISVADTEVEERVAEYLKRFASAQEAKKKIEPQDLKENMAQMLRNQKTLDRLAELVNVTTASDKP